MRLSNKRKLPLYRFFYTFLMLTLGLAVTFFLFNYFQLKILTWTGYLLLGISAFLLLLFIKRGRQIFEYDSDGEALNFINESVIPFANRPLKDEFPKYKLRKFQILDGLFLKKLYITISSKKSETITLKYDISYLTKKEVKDLKISLNRVIKRNNENKQMNQNKS